MFILFWITGVQKEVHHGQVASHVETDFHLCSQVNACIIHLLTSQLALSVSWILPIIHSLHFLFVISN